MSEQQLLEQLTNANSRIEQLEDILSAIKDYAASYAEFNPTYEKIVKMCEEGVANGEG